MPKSLKKKQKKNNLQKTENDVIGESGLNLKQEAFCKLYISEDKEFFGNGFSSYLEVYRDGIDTSKKGWHNVVMANASRLLRNAKVCEYINKRLEESGFNDQNVDKQLLFLLTQHSDFKSKLGAIKEYNSLRKRIGRDSGSGDTFNQFNILVTPENREEMGEKFKEFLENE